MEEPAPARGTAGWLGELVYDTRLAVRALLKSRGFTAVTLLTLSVGIGASTAIFSVVHGVLLSPLPYANVDRIVRVSTEAVPPTGLEELPFSQAGYWHFVENQRSYEAFGGYSEARRNYLSGDGATQDVSVAGMSVDAFEVLGMLPQAGRLPTREEERSHARVLLISHDLWVARFGSDPTVIGRPIASDWQAEVIGVMPEGFDFPSPDVDIWVPTRLDPARRAVVGILGAPVVEHTWLAIGRLRPEVSINDAILDAESLIAGFEDLGYEPQLLSGLFSGKALVRPLKEEIIGGATEPLMIALGTVLFVLLIVCSNVASLLLVRSESRVQEQAIRIALGSGRRRLIQYVMLESAVLTVVGCIGGIGLAHVMTRALIAAAPPSIPRLSAIGIDSTALFVALSAAFVVGSLIVLVPAARAGSRRALASVRAGGGGSTTRRERFRVMEGLVVAQTALALVLLVGSGLMVQSFQALRSVDAGFDPERVLTFSVTVGIGQDRRPEGFYFPLLDRLGAVPGVLSVSGTESLPMTGIMREAGSTLGPLMVDEFPGAEGELRPNFLVKRTMPGYFSTMGIPILEGREFTREDFSPGFTATAFVISASMKRRYWPDGSALGKRLTWGRMNGPVVGVVGDVHHLGLEAPAEEIVHTAQFIGRTMTMVLRTAGDPDRVMPGIRAALVAYDPEVPISRVQAMDDIVADSFSRTSFTMALLLVAGIVALFLSSLGVYGVISFVADRRSPEMGLRLALGASPDRVRRIVVSRGVALAAVGIGFGLLGSVALSKVLSSLLFGVSPIDGGTLASAALLLLAAATGSCVVPARRAAQTPPAVALRAEQ